METKGFKRRIGVDADDFIFQEALNKLKGGFRKKLPIKTPRKFRIKDLIPFGVGVFNKGGIVAKTKSKFKGHY